MALPLAGRVVVSAAGTRVAFPSNSKRVIALKIRAAEGNTNPVFIGDSTVSSTAGWVLLGGTDGVHSEVDWPIPDGRSIKLSDVYLDVTTDDELVYFIATLE